MEILHNDFIGTEYDEYSNACQGCYSNFLGTSRLPLQFLALAGVMILGVVIYNRVVK